MLVLSGIAVVVLGFALRANPLLVVVVAALVTGLTAGMHPGAVVAMLGHAFVANRFIAVAWLVLPVIGLLERGGIRERARILIGRLRAATPGRVLILYLALRQISATLGLVALGGHVQMVRPLIAPMAEAAAERQAPLDAETRDRVRAYAASADNVGVFFGEDVFVAIGSILLIKGFLEQNGIVVAPIRLSVWAIPTALIAFAVHATRLWLFDRRLKARSKA
ncbi:MAG: DUF969 domain-containing protein [Alphaproteobacteria bacterium]|nr:DUF969 domain-containing protein [Alphaproteobacteria bacterium]